MKLSPKVQAFAEAMQRKLDENEHKPGWRDSSYSYLFSRLEEECRELKEVYYGRGKRAAVEVAFEILMEAADVGNFAMMIADKSDALLEHRPESNAPNVFVLERKRR